MAGETDANPIHMKIVGTDTGPGKVLAMGLLTLIPVAIAILMQNPALRQSLQMKAWYATRKVCHTGAEWWRKMEVVADHHYDIARL